ncbi:unnamed protein product, partial [Aureobasidium mustum]
ENSVTMSDTQQYTVGWICAIAAEYTAALQFLDEEHDNSAHVSADDRNIYTLGKMSGHNVVIAVLPDGEYGLSSAASLAKDMLNSFPDIRIGLMVGIGSGAPTAKHDIRLGDIVVSNGIPGGVYQYDYDKTIQGRSFQQIGVLNQPPTEVRIAVSALESRYVRRGHQIDANITASMKDATIRDTIANEEGVMCFETEAAGLIDHMPCLIVRGICDYSDSHENKEWQGYAAMTAAAYTKDLLAEMKPSRVEQEKRIRKTLESTRDRSTNHNDEFILTSDKVGHITKWLSAPDPSTNHIRASEKHHYGTGLWFIHGDAFQEWKRRPGSFLWLYGIPGCGKTVLSSTIIEHLQKDTTCQELFYFYFDFTDFNKQSLDSLLRSLVYQVYRSRPESRQRLEELWAFYDQGDRQASTSSLQNELLAMLSGIDDICIVLDALDESVSRNGVLAWLKMLIKSTHCRILVTSRREEDIESALQSWTRAEQRLLIPQNEVNKDISVYVKDQIRNGYELERWRSRPDVQDEIEATLVNRADGIVCLDWPAMSRALANSPKTLDETYSRILDSIPEAHTQHATTIFRVLMWSKRPLRAEEIVDVIAVNIDEKPAFDPQNRLPVPREILRLCRGLVTISPVVDVTDSEHREQNWQFQLAHFSVREFLTSDHIDARYRHCMDQSSANAHLAKICLAYLSMLASQGLSLSEIRSRFPFAQYSARYWSDHARATEATDHDFSVAVRSFFDPGNAVFAICCRLFDPDRPELIPSDDTTTGLPDPLYVASLLGLEQAVETLLQNGQDVNVKCGRYGNPLQAASFAGHYEIVRILLDRGAVAPARGGQYDNALQAASFAGHHEIVRILLDRGAVVTARGGQCGNALHAAAFNGSYKIVQMLLSHGADVDARDEGWTPLNRAADEGHLEVEQHWTNSNTFSSRKEHLEIIELLLDSGAKINGHGTEPSDAIWGASQRGHEQILQVQHARASRHEGHSSVADSEFHDSGYSSNQTRPMVEDHKDVDLQHIDDDLESIATVETDIQSSTESIALSNVREAAAREVARAFIGDDEISKLYDEGIKRMQGARFIENHRRLLKLFYLEATKDAEVASHHVVLRFLRSRIARIRVSARIIQAKDPLNDELELAEDRDRSLQFIEDHLTQADKERNTSHWTEAQQSDFHDQEGIIPDPGEDASASLPHESLRLDLLAIDLNDDEDFDDFDVDNEEEAGLRVDDMPALGKTAAFLMNGRAFQIYRNNLQRFVYGRSLAPTAFQRALNASDLPTAIKLLEDEFEAVTQPRSAFEWIREPLAMGFTPTEVVELIIEERDEAPWIRYDLPVLELLPMDIAYHRPGCFHNPDPSVSSRDSEDRTPTLETISRIVSEMCGLGGVIPLLKARHLWDGHATFSAETARVSYQDATSTEPVLEDETGKKLLNRIRDALDRITVLIAWLQQHNLICDRFVIIKDAAKGASVEAVSVPLRVLAELKSNLEALSTSFDTSTADQIQVLLIRTSLGLLRLVCDVGSGNLNIPDSLELALDSAALAVQVVCVGMLSFSHAHLGKLDPFFLMHSIDAIELNGIDGPLSSRLSLGLRLKDLSCVGDMLGGPVMVFTRDKQPAAERHDLLTSLENLFELWGPGKLLVDQSSPTGRNLCGAVIGGGLVFQPSTHTSIFHWSQGAPEDVQSLTHGRRFGVDDVIAIGAFSVNQGCPFSQTCDTILPRLDTTTQPRTLGTFPEHWDLEEIQLGLSGGFYAMLALNSTWIKKAGRTKKRQIFENEWDLNTLEAPLGLLISVCTGVAQRVPLREVIGEVMPAMVAAMRKRPVEWDQLVAQGHDIANEYKKSTFRVWYNALQPPQRNALDRVANYVFKRICWTGVNHEEKLVVACPSAGDACGCIHMPREQNLPLASILKDSDQCATFACTTARCIETDRHKCRNSNHPKWQNKAPLLITSVCQYQRSNPEEWTRLPQQRLQDGRQYWMGRVGDHRKFVAGVRRNPGSPALLTLSDSLCRGSFLRLALERAERMRKSCCIRLLEKNLSDDVDAEEVFVLSSA